MSIRLVLAIFSTLLEEAAIVVVVLWGLPELEIHIPFGGLIALMAGWGVWSVFSYRICSRALMRKPLVGLPAMIGSRGKVVNPLVPEGLVRIKGELWVAKSASKRINTGEEVTVVGQDGLRLIVSKSNTGDSKGTE